MEMVHCLRVWSRGRAAGAQAERNQSRAARPDRASMKFPVQVTESAPVPFSPGRR
jgi:hypothetical protein